MFGSHFKYLGVYDGRDAWLFVYPDNQEIGFPSVFLYKDGTAQEVSGFFALDIISSFGIE